MYLLKKHAFTLYILCVEYCKSAYQTVMKVPDGVSLVNAAGIRKCYTAVVEFTNCQYFFSISPAEVFLTAYQALVFNARMTDGDTVLIHAVSSWVVLTVVNC